VSITLKEICKSGNYNLQHKENITELLRRVNELRTAYGKPLLVTSGYRSLEDHLRIYKAKGITDQSKIPMKSRHLSGEAVDFAPVEESISEFQKWVKDNIKEMERIGLWFEDFSATPTWVHC
jgi:uncharacterized protein YcbK (DUF882 family)